MTFMLLLLAQSADIQKLLTHSIRPFIVAEGLVLCIIFCCQDREESCLVPRHAPSYRVAQKS